MAKTEITTKYTRVQLAWEIVIGQLTVLMTVIVLHISKGFDAEQMTALTAILMPFTGLYLGVALQEFSKESEAIPNLPHGRKLRWMVWILFGFVEAIILLSGLAPKYLAFRELVVILSVVQAFFGVQMGNLLKKIFDYDEKKPES